MKGQAHPDSPCASPECVCGAPPPHLFSPRYCWGTGTGDSGSYGNKKTLFKTKGKLLSIKELKYSERIQIELRNESHEASPKCNREQAIYKSLSTAAAPHLSQWRNQLLCHD